MRFTATGTLGGRRVSVTWEDGAFVEGDAGAIAFFIGLARGFEGKALSIPTAFTSYENHMQKPLAVGALFEYGFGGDVEFSGDLPQVPSHPEGTIA